MNFTTSSSFLGCSPLKDLDSIAIYPFYLTNIPSLRSDLYKNVVQSLEQIGDIKVINLAESFDVTGFTQSQCEMMLRLSRIFDEKGNELPSQLSL